MSELASRIADYLMEKTERAYKRVQRRFNIEWVGELPYNRLTDVQFQVWAEKDAPDDYAPRIAGLYACRGFATLVFIQNWAAAIYDNAYDACPPTRSPRHWPNWRMSRS